MFCIAEVGDAATELCVYELYVDPHSASTLEYWRRAAEQTHYKVVVYDYELLEVAAFYDLENVFGFEAAAGTVEEFRDAFPAGDFGRAQQLAMQEYSIEDLRRLGRGTAFEQWEP